MIPVVINYNNNNVLSDSDSGSSEVDFKNNNDTFFDKDIDDKVKANP